MRSVKIILFVLWPVFSLSQVNPLFLEPTKKQADSLREMLGQNINDTLRMAANRELTLYYLDINSDSALFFVEEVLPLARKLKLKLWEADALDLLGIVSNNKGNYIRAIKSIQEALRIAESKESEKNIWRISKFTNTNDPEKARLNELATIYSDMSGLYATTGHYDKQINAIRECIKIAERIKDHTLLSQAYRGLGAKYQREKKMDSALILLRKALAYSDSSGFYKYQSNTYNRIGMIYLAQNAYALALENIMKGLQSAKEQNNNPSISQSYLILVQYFNKIAQTDSALYYARLALSTSHRTAHVENIIDSYDALSGIYKSLGRPDSALKYLELANAANDSLLTLEKIKQLENIGFNEQLRLHELEKERRRIGQWRVIASLGFLILVFAVIMYFQWRNSRQKKRANLLLQEEKEKVESTLSELKSTQAQLIQSEKMASLGELTAGIAHEIQNPLNFVNNFAEVNTELIDELRAELAIGNMQQAKEIAENLKQNEEKIRHHGKRADSIVKGMLQHSRSSNGVKEATDINALADEYLRLAYHGLRAKDKSFNATMKTDYDKSIGPVNIVPQDIGRVILNLITNAFYVVAEKKKQNGIAYEPTVTVSTKKIGNKVEITVKDNGNGIPPKVMDKIFQPFFTTKPAGQGTGLGLSLSYDIVKAHGGEIKVVTKEGEGSEFITQLPIV